MQGLSFVAALNGLGHARRLFVLAQAATSLGLRARIILTSRQAKMMRDEFPNVSAHVSIIESNQLFEIDGPSFGKPSDQVITEVPRTIFRVVEESEICISDNLLWPTKYAERSIILGNFLWSEYWETVAGNDAVLKEHITFEYEQVRKATVRLANRGLTFKHNPRIPVSGEYPFLRYPGDYKLRSTTLSDKVWYSKGTTGLAASATTARRLLGIEDSKTFMEVETWELGRAREAPGLIFGRPGIGTLRDSMAAGIPFLPMLGGPFDPELKQNAKFALSHFNIPQDSVEPGNGLIELWGKAQDFASQSRKNNLEKWFKISSEPTDVLRDIVGKSFD